MTPFALTLAGVSLLSFAAGAYLMRRHREDRIAELDAITTRALEDKDAAEDQVEALMEERAEMIRELNRYRSARQRLSIN